MKQSYKLGKQPATYDQRDLLFSHYRTTAPLPSHPKNFGHENLNQLLEALYLFGVVGIGFNFPSSAMDQFNAGKPWSVVPGAKLDGGHYVPLVGFRTNLLCVSWGQIQQMTPQFFKNIAMKLGRFFH